VSHGAPPVVPLSHASPPPTARGRYVIGAIARRPGRHGAAPLAA
jgi:hypothetical protein